MAENSSIDREAWLGQVESQLGYVFMYVPTPFRHVFTHWRRCLRWEERQCGLVERTVDRDSGLVSPKAGGEE